MQGARGTLWVNSAGCRCSRQVRCLDSDCLTDIAPGRRAAYGLTATMPSISTEIWLGSMTLPTAEL
jgi:hypothetical protein